MRKKNFPFIKVDVQGVCVCVCMYISHVLMVQPRANGFAGLKKCDCYTKRGPEQITSEPQPNELNANIKKPWVFLPYLSNVISTCDTTLSSQLRDPG